MARFAIKYYETYARTYYVEGNNFDEASDKLYNAIFEGKIDGPEECIDAETEDFTCDELLYYLDNNNLDVK